MEKVTVLNKKTAEKGTVLAWDTGRSNASVFIVVAKESNDIALWDSGVCCIVPDGATPAAIETATGVKPKK